MKAELSRIEEKNNISKEMKESWELKKPKIMAALKKTNCRPVSNVMVKLDDCEVSDERGIKNYLPYIYFIFTAITGFA